MSKKIYWRLQWLAFPFVNFPFQINILSKQKLPDRSKSISYAKGSKKAKITKSG